MIGEAICWGTVKSAVRRGAGEFGVGVGRGLREWFSKRLPQNVQERRRQELEPQKK